MSSNKPFNLLLIIVAVLPFLTPGSIFINLPDDNLKTLWGVFGLLAVLIVWLLDSYNNKKLTIYKTRFYWPIIGFITWSVVSLLWVDVYYLAILELARFITYGFVFFLTVNVVKSFDRARLLLHVLIVVMSIVSIIGLVQYYFQDNLFIDKLFMQTAKPGSTFINKNMASHFMVMTLPLSIVFLLSANSKSRIALYAITTTIGTWFVIYTTARQAYVAIAVEFSILLLFIALDHWQHNKESLWVATKSKPFKGVALSCIVVFLLLVANYLPGKHSNNKINDIESIVELENNPRIPAWVNTLEMIKEQPMVGVGIGQWRVEYPPYYDRVRKDIIFDEGAKLQKLHNDYLEQIANLGLIGFSFLLWLVYLAIKTAWIALSTPSNKNRHLTLSVCLGMIGFSIVAFFSFPTKLFLPPFLVMLFLAVVALNSTTVSEYRINIKSIRYYQSGSLLVSLVVGVVMIFGYKWAYAQHHYAQSFLISKFSDNYIAAIAENAKAIKSGILREQYYHSQGYYYLQIQEYEKAIPFLEIAEFYSKNNINILLNLGIAYKESGGLDKERQMIKAILKVDPKHVVASALLVRSLVDVGDNSAATLAYKKLKNNFEYFKGRQGFGPYHDTVISTALYVGDYRYVDYLFGDLMWHEASTMHFPIEQVTKLKHKVKTILRKEIKLNADIEISEAIKADLNIK